MWFGNSFSNYIVLLVLKYIYPSIDFYVLFLLRNKKKKDLKKYLSPTPAAVLWIIYNCGGNPVPSSKPGCEFFGEEVIHWFSSDKASWLESLRTLQLRRNVLAAGSVEECQR